MKNYYQILGIKREAGADEIKKAYRKHALLYHPDKNKFNNTHEQFIKITEAYEILSNEINRKKYDILYTKFYINSEELTNENIESFAEWEQKGNEKAQEYAKKSYNDFIKIINELTFHALNYAKIGCIGGIFIFLGILWIIAPIIIIATSNLSDVAIPAILSFFMGVGALIIGNKKIKELKEDYQIKKSSYKS